MGATQALSAMNPSLVYYLGANPYSVAGKTMLALGNDIEESGHKKAKLKLEQEEAAWRNKFYDDKNKNDAAKIEADKANDMAKQQNDAAAREANIAAIKANNPDFANSFVMNSAKGGEYMDPTQKARLEQGLGYVKLGDVKDKQPNLQHIQLKDGEIGVFNPQTGDVRGTGVKGEYTNPYSLANYKASLSLDTEEKRPTAKELGKKMASVADYIGKGYAAQGLTGDPAKDKIIKSYSFGSIDGKYLIPPAQIDSFKKEIGLR